MQEYFALNRKDNGFILSEQDIFQITKVLRMKQNDHIVVIYEKEKYDCLVSFAHGETSVNINRKIDINNELSADITLIYGLPKKDKFELVVQKACELGVTRIVPFEAMRSVSLLREDNASKKISRWNMIAKEACEQSKRNIKVEVTDQVNLKGILNYKSDVNLVAYELLNDTGTSKFYDILKDNPKSITILVGPEGGFDESEIDFLIKNGFESVSLGKRILRSETAPLYMLSVIGFMLERNIE